MDFELSSLIELYAYKVEDLEKGREPRGGRASLLQLRKYLLEASLPGPLAKRFREIDRRYRESPTTVSEEGRLPAAAQIPDLDIDLGIVELPLEEEQLHEPDEPQKIQQFFAEQVYWTRLKRELGRVARSYLGGRRYELRLVYTFLQNFETYSQTPTFASDFNLSRFKLIAPIPSLSDPLVSLEDEDVALALLLELFHIAMDLGDLNKYPLSLPPEGVVPYLRRFLRHIVETPEALPVTIPGGGPSTEELRAALDEARRSALTAHEREALVRDLEEKLRKAAAEERRMQLVIEEDRSRLLVAAARLSALLQRYLPAPRGEAAFPRVPEPLAGSGEPGSKMGEIPKGTTMVTLQRVPMRFQLGGIPMTLSVAGDNIQLTIAGTEHQLKEDEPLIAPYDNWEVWAFRYGDYVHIRLEVREGAQLSQLLVEGGVLAHLVHPYKDYAYLRLMRAFSARLKGPINYEEYAPESARRFAEASLDTLEAFARKGMGVVKSRLQRTPGGLKLLREVAEDLGLKAEGQKLFRLLSDWLNYRPPTRETLGGELGVATIASEPVNIQAGNLVLSVRQADGVVYVGSAGSVPRKLDDLMIWPLEEEAVVIAREGNRVAHTTVKVV
ncbi:hypothetical protein [Oceanithermus sp.]